MIVPVSVKAAEHRTLRDYYALKINWLMFIEGLSTQTLCRELICLIWVSW